jgi:hypothetical protein
LFNNKKSENHDVKYSLQGVDAGGISQSNVSIMYHLGPAAMGATGAAASVQFDGSRAPFAFVWKKVEMLISPCGRALSSWTYESFESYEYDVEFAGTAVWVTSCVERRATNNGALGYEPSASYVGIEPGNLAVTTKSSLRVPATSV